jgi:hypothetical protein
MTIRFIVATMVLGSVLVGCSATGSLPTERFTGKDATKVEKYADTCTGEYREPTDPESHLCSCGCHDKSHHLTKKEADEAGVKCACHKD